MFEQIGGRILLTQVEQNQSFMHHPSHGSVGASEVGLNVGVWVHVVGKEARILIGQPGYMLTNEGSRRRPFDKARLGVKNVTGGVWEAHWVAQAEVPFGDPDGAVSVALAIPVQR